jgi:hypothetical protein
LGVVELGVGSVLIAGSIILLDRIVANAHPGLPERPHEVTMRLTVPDELTS